MPLDNKLSRGQGYVNALEDPIEEHGLQEDPVEAQRGNISSAANMDEVDSILWNERVSNCLRTKDELSELDAPTTAKDGVRILRYGFAIKIAGQKTVIEQVAKPQEQSRF